MKENISRFTIVLKYMYYRLLLIMATRKLKRVPWNKYGLFCTIMAFPS